jgi:ribonuclease P protein component
VAREGKRIRTEHLEIRAVASLFHHPRVGFIVPKYGQNSVARNRLKRRLREITRTALMPALPVVDMVIRARPGAYRISYATLVQELTTAGNRLGTLFGIQECAGS